MTARERIEESLTNAYEGGYQNDVMQHPDEVAEDMAEHDSDVERMIDEGVIDFAELSRIIAEWQTKRGKL